MDDLDLPASLTAGQAIAWTLTGDKAFTLESRYGSSLRVEICFNKWKLAGGNSPFKSAERAGQELLELIDNGAVEARGTRFRRKAPDGQFEQCERPDSVITTAYLTWDAEDNLWLVSEDGCVQFRDVAIDTAGLLREFKPAPASTMRKGKSSGRPPKYDWPAFDAECLRLHAVHPNWTLTDLERAMADWCVDHFGREPAHSVLQDHINRVLRRAA